MLNKNGRGIKSVDSDQTASNDLFQVQTVYTQLFAFWVTFQKDLSSADFFQI